MLSLQILAVVVSLKPLFSMVCTGHRETKGLCSSEGEMLLFTPAVIFLCELFSVVLHF